MAHVDVRVSEYADLSIDKPLSHEAAACGREDRHRTGGAAILVWVGIVLVRMAEIPETSSSRTRLGAPRESTVERGAGPPTCAEWCALVGR
jgi:hypothetical protein